MYSKFIQGHKKGGTCAICSLVPAKRHLMPAIVVSACASLLISCASRPDDVLRPVSTSASGSSSVDMLVATTRLPANDPGKLYSGERGPKVSVDRLVVSIPPQSQRKIGEIQWPTRTPADPGREFAVLNVQSVTTDKKALEWFRVNRNSKKQAVIFIHGFNTTYAEAVFRFAQLTHDTGIDAAPVLFTWPSRANVFDYLYDKESTNFSRRALEDLILQAVNSPDVGDITIVAHSMGTWLTMEALRGVAMRNQKVPSKVSNVILAAPDIDVDVFDRQMADMGPLRPRFLVLTSTADKALDASRWLSGGVDRLGIADPATYEQHVRRLGITVVDTKTSAKDQLGHGAFANSPEIIAVLGNRLSGQSLQVDHASLIDRVGIVAIGASDLTGKVTRAAFAAQRKVP